jgi:Flp pilus assembly protein TadG
MKMSDKPAILQGLWVRARGAVRACSEEGDVLFEFAMVLPLLSMLLVGVIYGGMTFYNYVELTNSVSAGARTLANGRAAGSNACSQANTAITNSAGNLKSSQLVTGTVSFAGSSSCTSSLVPGDAGVVSAVYPCNVPIPFTNMNLCPMSSGSSITAPWTGGPTLVTCPYSYCISATTTVYIE